MERKMCGLVQLIIWISVSGKNFNQIPLSVVLPSRKGPAYLCHNSYHLPVLYGGLQHDLYHVLQEEVPTG